MWICLSGHRVPLFHEGLSQMVLGPFPLTPSGVGVPLSRGSEPVSLILLKPTPGASNGCTQGVTFTTFQS